MPSAIVDILYTISPMPTEDKEFLRVLQLAPNYLEEKKWDYKTRDSKSYKHDDKKSEKKENK
jgi:hypothetical protein